MQHLKRGLELNRLFLRILSSCRFDDQFSEFVISAPFRDSHDCCHWGKMSGLYRFEMLKVGTLTR